MTFQPDVELLRFHIKQQLDGIESVSCGMLDRRGESPESRGVNGKVPPKDPVRTNYAATA